MSGPFLSRSAARARSVPRSSASLRGTAARSPEDSSFRRPLPIRVSSSRSRTRARQGEAMPVDKSIIGRKGEPVTMHVERGKIREFARAIRDDDPLYFDEAYAEREAGGIMPPLTFLQTVSHWDDGRGRPRRPMDVNPRL